MSATTFPWDSLPRIGRAEAALVRALEPVRGLEAMRERRGREPARALCSGPGKLCQALGIERSYDGEDLLGRRVWLEETDSPPADEEIAAGARVGVAYAGADALKPWRFWVKGSEYVSRRTS